MFFFSSNFRPLSRVSFYTSSKRFISLLRSLVETNQIISTCKFFLSLKHLFKEIGRYFSFQKSDSAIVDKILDCSSQTIEKLRWISIAENKQFYRCLNFGVLTIATVVTTTSGRTAANEHFFQNIDCELLQRCVSILDTFSEQW